MNLAPAHFKFLRASTINDEYIAAMACYSVPPAEIDRLSPALRACESLLAFPYPGVDGFCRYRLFPPLGKMKYWQPVSSPLHLYILPVVRSVLSNPNIDLAITEGEKKAACLTQHGIRTIGLGGVWSWGDGSGDLHPEFDPAAFVDRSVLIVFDADTWTNVEIQHALYALGKAVEGRGGKVEALIIPPAPDGSKQGADDFIAANGVGKFQELKRIKLRHDGLAQHKPWWEHWRKGKAKDEKEIDKLAPRLQPVEPWDQPVDGAVLLDEMRRAIARFVVTSPEAINAMCLWILLAHGFDAFSILAMLVFSSPVRQCGKSLSQAIVGKLVPKPLTTSNISPAALFRVIEKFAPTLIVDECDSAFSNNPELRELVNASHLRSQAFVCRTVGDNHEPSLFCTWGAKCLALIGALPDTTASRSIIIRMQRKTRADKVEKFSAVKAYPELTILQRKGARWVADNMAALRQAEPDALADANDRDQDNWLPLFAIAGLAGGEWPRLAREAARKLAGEPDDEAKAIELLKDIKIIFDGDPESESAGCEVVASADLVSRLNDKDGRPWADYRRGHGITSNQIARMLKGFGIYPRVIRIDDKTTRGYCAEWFFDTFPRYLPLYNRNIRNTSCENNNLGQFCQPLQNENVTLAESDLSSRPVSNVTDVTVAEPPLEGDHTNFMPSGDDIPDFTDTDGFDWAGGKQRVNGADTDSEAEANAAKWRKIKAEHAAKRAAKN